MKTEITKSEFTAAFHNMGRGDNFSHAGLCALYDWLEEFEEDTESEIEFDVIAFCCEFSEYADLSEVWDTYNTDPAPEDEETIRDWINEQTIFTEFSGGVIIQNF